MIPYSPTQYGLLTMTIKFFYFAGCMLLSAMGAMAQQSGKDPLQELRAKWLGAKARAVKPIDAIYVKELQELKVAETKKGDLQAALRVEAEIKAVTEQIAMDDVNHEDGDAMRKALKNSMRQGLTGNLAGWTLQLKDDGSVPLTHADGSPGWGGWSWKVADDGKVTITLPNAPTKPLDVKLSKPLDRMSFAFGNSTLKRNQGR